MKRCAATIVSRSQVKASQLEKVDRDRLIALGSHMEHVDTKIVPDINVCPVFNQKLTSIGITFEGCEV